MMAKVQTQLEAMCRPRLRGAVRWTFREYHCHD